MYLHFLQQLFQLAALFSEQGNLTNFSAADSNSSWESEELTSLWELEGSKNDLHKILFPLPPSTVSFPVCCNLDQGVETFQCATKETTKRLALKGNLETNSRFKRSEPRCAKEHKFVIFDSKSIPVKMDNDEKHILRFLENGYFGYNNEFYSPEEYCINSLTGEFAEVKICEPECSKNNPCIQKCCEPDQIYSFSLRQCVKSNSVFKPIFYEDMSNRVSDQEQKSLNPHFTVKSPRSFKYHCNQANTTQIFPSGNLFAEYLSNTTGRNYFPADFHVRRDGNIIYRKDGKAIVLPDGHPIFLKDNSRKCYKIKTLDYCIDGGRDYGDSQEFSNDEGQTFLVACSEQLYQPPVIGPLSPLYGFCMLFSSFFSLLTVIVYLILKEKRNIYGMTVVSYALSVFFMYVSLGLAHLIRYYGSDEVLKTKVCVFIGISSHLFSLTSFLWLTVMNWDLYTTFAYKKIRPINSNGRGQVKLWTNYLKYSIVGWGLPLMIISVSSYLHFNYEEAAEDDCAEIGLSLPAYGRESCEIKTKSLGVYLYFPASVLLFCNLLFFGFTTYSLCKHGKTTLIAVKRIERHNQSTMLFGKLFFTMGVTRVFEVITWYESGINLVWYWAVFDIFNIFQAVAIFIIYVCKSDVLLSLKDKFPTMDGIVTGFLHFKLRRTGYEDSSLSQRKKNITLK